MEAMYEAAGLLTTETGALSILAGSTLGGGTRYAPCWCTELPSCHSAGWHQLFSCEKMFSINLCSVAVCCLRRVNWCASFRTPDHVRREWAQEYGLEAFAGDEYTVALDAVCARLGVRTGIHIE